MVQRILLISSLIAPRVCIAQSNAAIEGTIVDKATQQPIAFVNVLIRGSKIGTTTDSLGNFHIDVPVKQSLTIVFSHVAYDKIIRNYTFERPEKLFLKLAMTSHPIQASEVVVTGTLPFREQRARFTLGEKEIEQTGEISMERLFRYFFSDAIKPLINRMMNDRDDFTLYINGEWKESLFLDDIDPFTVRRVLIWQDPWSPVGLPLRRGRYVVNIETK